MVDIKHIKLPIVSAVVLAAFIGVGVSASVGTRGNTEDPIHASVDERRGPHDWGVDFEVGGIGEEAAGRRLGKGSTLSPSKRPTASPTDAPTDEPTTGSPSGSPTTPSPTDCEHGRKWHANEDATKCTNAHLPDGDEWDTVTECCDQLFVGPGEPCKFEDVCNTSMPTTSPTANPSASPTPAPSRMPSRQPTRRPSNKPSMRPTAAPSTKPSRMPTRRPSAKPSAEPSAQPSTQPTVSPSTPAPTTPAPTTASPSPAPTLSPVTPFPTTTTPTWMPTSCEGRQWYIISENSGLKQCTNGHDIPDGYDRGWDFYDSRDECCQLEFGAGNCDFLDACEPTASPTTSPATPAPTICASLPWKLLNGHCTNNLESVSNDEGHSLYSSAEECCAEEFVGDACIIDDICISDTPTAAPTSEATQGSTPTVGKGAEFEEDTPLGPRV